MDRTKLQVNAGDAFGALTAVRFARRRESRVFWLFRCVCGRERELMAGRVAAGKWKSCGCRAGKRPKPPAEVAGQKWGLLTAVSFSHREQTRNGLQWWKFRCECGNETTESLYKVKNGYVGSCGCVGKRGVREVRRDMQRTFGMTDAEADDFMRRTEGACEICRGKCKQSRRLSVDHCHTSGVLRGALCQNCNRLLGLAKDSASTLRAAADYLDNHGGKHK